MDEREPDEEMLRETLEWLNRGMDADGRFPEVHPTAELALTEGDHALLRAYKIIA